jgi:hypothetical protein
MPGDRLFPRVLYSRVDCADDCLITSRCGLTYDIFDLIGDLWKYLNGQHAYKFAVIKYQW